jgi:hypothetical protein
MKTKTILSLRLALAGAAALLTHTTFAQAWHTVDDFQYVPGAGSVAQVMTKDPAGNLYAAGYVFANDGGTHALIGKSSDGGTNWSVIDDFTNGDPYPGYEYYGITADAAGRLYAVGDDFWGTNPGGWFVRGSHDGGLTWSTLDAFTLGGGSSSTAYGVATDSAGNVYVVGDAGGSWTVRKGTLNRSGGLSWATVDKFAPGRSAAGVVCLPTGIFVLGNGFGGGPWYVRRSVNGGATWTTVNTYRTGLYPSAIGADASGNLYVVGGVGAGWTVRKGGKGGTSWTTVDNFIPSVGWAAAFGFAADSHGNLFVVGITADASWIRRWMVRENPGGVGSWRTVDIFQYPGGDTEAYGAVADNLGHVFVAGFEGGSSWLVRKN